MIEWRIAFPTITIMACLALSVFSCAIEPPSAVNIIFPQDGTKFTEGDEILLASDANVAWNSSLDGYLGTGKEIKSILTCGIHTISILSEKGCESSIEIEITPPQFVPGRQDIIVPTQGGMRRLLAAGSYAPVILSCADSFTEISISLTASSRGMRTSYPAIRETLIRDVLFSAPEAVIKNNATFDFMKNQIDAPSAASSFEYALHSEKTFKLADPALGTMAEGYTVTAELIALDDDVSVWLAAGSASAQPETDQFIESILNTVIPRARTIYGSHLDIDGDGHLAILLSDKLNQGRIAIGFFNPCDFFPYSDSAGAQDYNPTSNHCDIIYAGVPESIGPDMNFSKDAIAATIGHEYQHLVRFGEKTFRPAEAGEENPPQEDPAFNEAVSHYTESLIGFGVSGGNLLFVQRYLSDPSRYSIRAADSDGAEDSAGKRGCGALFISYLVGKSGGAQWDTTEPNALSKSDGLVFLRRSMASPLSGWDFCEEYFGMPMASLWKEFCLSLNSESYSNVHEPLVMDPSTGEPNTLNAFLGAFPFGTSTIYLGGPERTSVGSSISINAWSAIFAEEILLPDKASILLSTTQANEIGKIFAAFLHVSHDVP